MVKRASQQAMNQTLDGQCCRRTSPQSGDPVAIFGARLKGRHQMGETGFCKNLRFPAKICGFLRFSAQICDSQIPWFTERAENQRKSAKICEKVRSGSGFSLLLSPFWHALTFFAWLKRQTDSGARILSRKRLLPKKTFVRALPPGYWVFTLNWNLPT